MSEKQKVYVFDTTLRDGEQVPGCQLNTDEKVEIALDLEDLGVAVSYTHLTLPTINWV